jgi:hypothetical protein
MSQTVVSPWISRLKLEFQDWCASPEGKAAIEQSAEEARKMIEELREARRIDPADLRKPICEGD